MKEIVAFAIFAIAVIITSCFVIPAGIIKAAVETLVAHGYTKSEAEMTLGIKPTRVGR